MDFLQGIVLGPLLDSSPISSSKGFAMSCGTTLENDYFDWYDYDKVEKLSKQLSPKGESFSVQRLVAGFTRLTPLVSFGGFSPRAGLRSAPRLKIVLST